MESFMVYGYDQLARNPLGGYQFIEKLQEDGVDLICTDERFPIGLPLITRFLR